MKNTNILHVGDQHLDDKPENSYRWELFPTIKKLIKTYKIGYVILYGDLTEYKDRHTGLFINQVKTSIETYLKGVEVFILKGNHDYKDPDNPTFRFLGMLPHVTYVDHPLACNIGPKKAILLPHSDDPGNDPDWRSVLDNNQDADFICTHITVDKAKSENGQSLSGISHEFFNGIKVYSGDVHVPQVIDNVTYIGMPYRKNFGDAYYPRLLLTTEDGDKSLLTTSIFITRHLLKISSLEELDEHELKENDQVKIRYFLEEKDLINWDEIYQQVLSRCKKKKWDLHQVEAVLQQSSLSNEDAGFSAFSYDPAEILQEFMQAKYAEVSSFYTKSGLEIIEQVEVNE